MVAVLQLVDGVITEDSDALLFGATVVYRHFSCDKKVRHVPLQRRPIQGSYELWIV